MHANLGIISGRRRKSPEGAPMMRSAIFLIAAASAFALPCAPAAVIHLLATNNSNPNGTGVYQNGGGATGGGSMLPFLLANNTCHTLRLDHGSLGVSAFSQFGLKTTNMYAQAWTPSGFFAGNPFAPGNLLGRRAVPPPSITQVGSGIIFGQPITNYVASWAAGSLQSFNLVLQPGQSVYFTMAVDNQANSNGHWLVRESTLSAPSDTLWRSGAGYQPFTNISWTQHHGRLEGNWAFVIVGGCVADVDDGSGAGMPDCGVTIDDLLYYLSIFEAGSIDADVDDGTSTGTRDGGVTIDDLLYFLLRFESGC